MEILRKIKSIKLCLMAHPDNEEHSEFADRIEDLEEIEMELSKINIPNKLQEKFRPLVWFNYLSSNVYQENDKDLKSKECEIIADEFAIGFAEWVIDGNISLFLDTPKELLEIYKNEKGL